MAAFFRKPRLEEFEAAALPHLNGLFRTATRILSDAGRADELVQEVYLKAWEGFGQFPRGGNCRAWLFRILFHSLNHYCHQSSPPGEIQTAAESSVTLPHITNEELMSALSALAIDYRTVVLLVDVEEFSYKDASAILRIPIGAVISRLCRGRRLLRERLAGMAESCGIGRAAREGRSA